MARLPTQSPEKIEEERTHIEEQEDNISYILEGRDKF